MTYYQNRIEISALFCFTSNRQLSEAELIALRKALDAAMGNGPADELLEALREQLPEDIDADDFCGLGGLWNDSRIELISEPVNS